MPRPNPLSLLAVTGLPGCGKTTVIHEVLSHVEMTFVETDACWKELFPQPRYTPEESRAVFEHVLCRVESCLRQGASVIVEGVFASPERLQRLHSLATLQRARFTVVGLECPFPVAHARMHTRFQTQGQPPVPDTLWHELAQRVATWQETAHVRWLDSARLSSSECARQITDILRPLPESLPQLS